MDMYQHDSATTFQFVLRGELADDSVWNLEHAWTTAKSILDGKELVVEVSGITSADSSGIALLSRMRESGARLTAALPPASEGVLRSLGLPVAAPSGWYDRLRAWRLLRLGRSCE
jgi:ABC-type transporter Mla MlaB component